MIAHIQSQAGRQHLAVLTFAYTGDNQTVDIEYVRIKKPDGAVATKCIVSQTKIPNQEGVGAKSTAK